MDNLKALGRGTQVMFIAAVLLLIVMFFHWQEVDTALGSFGQNAWHGFWGVVMGILTIVLVGSHRREARGGGRSDSLVVRDDELRARRAHRDLRRPEAPHRRLPELLGVHRRRSRDRRRHRRVARGAGGRRNRVAQERREQPWIERLRDGCPRRSGRRTLDPGSGPAAPAPEMPAAADTAHDAAETAASEAPDTASEAADAPSDAADAASDAMSDEPSTERES